MTTLQTGTKVLIEATVEMTDGKDDTTLVRFKTSGQYWMDNSDLTVCETAEVDPKKQQVKAGDILKLVSDFGSDFTKGKDYPVLKVYEDEGRSVFVIKPDTKGMPEQSFYGSRIGSDFIIVNEDGAEPQPIDPNNFMVDITNPVNTELLPWFKEYVKRVYYAQNKKYVIDPDWTIYRFVEVRDGVIDLTNNEFMKLTTLPDLQKQHPGVFELQQNDEWRPNNGESKVEWTKQTEWNPTPSFKAGQEEIEIGQTYFNPFGQKCRVVVFDGEDKVNHPYVCFNEFNYCYEGWLASQLRPIPAQPTVESELEGIFIFFDLHKTRITEDLKTDILAWHQKHSGRVEVSVPSDEEIEKEAKKRYGETPPNPGQYQSARPLDIARFIKGAQWMRDNFMTRKEAKP